MKEEKEKILVTGGAGFIGSHVVKHLLGLGHQVVVLDDLSGGFKEQVPNDAEFIKGSITDETLIKKIFEENNFTYVYHLAAYAAEGLSHFIKKFNYENNLIGSVNLINASVNSGVKCFVFTSSIAVYGANQLPMTEDMVPEPEDPYGIAKYAVEQELATSYRMFGLDYVIFRPHNVYGEHQNIGDRYRNVIGIFMNKIMQGEPVPIFGDGKQTRAFSYIDDVAPYIVKAAFDPKLYGQTFNIGADKPYTVLELAETVAREMGAEPRLEFLEERKEVKHAYADHTKACQAFSIKKTVPLELGIKKMADWAKKAGAKKSKNFENIEIPKNLPTSWSSK